MALINCSECGREVSDKAPSCPGCGAPIAAAEAQSPRDESVPDRTPVEVGRNEIICPNPNCGYIGKPRKKARGSIIVGLILCLFFLLPGIIYFMLKSGYKYSCPKCGVQISNDN